MIGRSNEGPVGRDTDELQWCVIMNDGWKRRVYRKPCEKKKKIEKKARTYRDCEDTQNGENEEQEAVAPLTFLV